jgi:hypothetical protein
MSDQEFRIKKGLRVQDVLAINDQGNIANADRIPEIPISKTTNLQTSLDDKVSLTANVDIGGVKTFSNNTIFNGDVGIGTSTPSESLHVIGDILASGDVTAFSDITLKENIKPIKNAVGKVKCITGVTYTRNDVEDTDLRYTGVIAQEVEAVLPEAISTHNNGIKSVAYGNMVGLLIEAIKEQQKSIETLEHKIISIQESMNGF